MSTIDRTKFARRAQDHITALVVLVVGLGLSIATPKFLTATNVTNVLEQASLIGIIAVGMTMLLVSGNFDLSVGGMVAFVGVVAATAVNELGLVLGIVCGLVLGVCLGTLNGFIVVRLKINSLMATLGTGLAFVGLAELVTNQSPVVLTSPQLQEIVAFKFGVVLPVWVFAAVVVVSIWFLHTTVGGRQLFAVGANAEAARYAGVRVDLVRFVPFVITGLYSAIAAVLLLGQLGSALPNAASTWPLLVIAAAVVGGVSIAGGRGTVLMAVYGVLLIHIVNNGFNLLDFNSAYQSIFTGAIIVAAVAVDAVARSRSTSVFTSVFRDARRRWVTTRTRTAR